MPEKGGASQKSKESPKMINRVPKVTYLQLSMGESLKLLRRAADLNQTQLAELLECSQGTISKHELDQISLTVFQLNCIRKAFGISADDFLDSRIDFIYIAHRFGNHDFSLSKYLLKHELAEAA